MPVTNIPTRYDAEATKTLRKMVLDNEELSKALAAAVSKVLEQHGFKPAAGQLVTLEPVVSQRIDAKNVQPFSAGSNSVGVQNDLNVGIHLVETRSPIVDYAITSSAWNG